MTHVRNRRRRNLKRGFISAGFVRRLRNGNEYNRFWHVTEPARQAERDRIAIEKAEAARVARKQRLAAKRAAA